MNVNICFSKKQLKLVQTEFLDVYRHFLAQLAHLSGKLAEEIRFFIEKMLEHYDAGNPYIVSCYSRKLSHDREKFPSLNFGNSTLYCALNMVSAQFFAHAQFTFLKQYFMQNVL